MAVDNSAESTLRFGGEDSPFGWGGGRCETCIRSGVAKVAKGFRPCPDCGGTGEYAKGHHCTKYTLN